MSTVQCIHRISRVLRFHHPTNPVSETVEGSRSRVPVNASRRRRTAPLPRASRDGPGAEEGARSEAEATELLGITLPLLRHLDVERE
ncbi:hypothetical protein GCM10011490_05580 [Pseudoclavibacter endophyticus]|nr:hypothetical protein GCM10011490_05580 [Pseudoclavibacter endophyticus]